MCKNTLFFFLFFFVAGCATIIDGQMQEVTMRTPGAENAKCILDTQEGKYEVYTDETILIKKAPFNMFIDCMAPGNRRQQYLVKQEMSEWVYLNITNGIIPGTAYDMLSRAAFHYPDVLTIDFTGVEATGYGLPDYHAKDLPPITHVGEYYGPSTVEYEPYRGVSTLGRKENLYGEAPYEIGAEPPTGPVYQGPVVPVKPGEEDK
jgi:hypothetical protein